MGLIDLILNVAGLLLWLSWRAARFDALGRPKALTLLGTLRRAGATKSARWQLLATLAALLVLRAFLYQLLGAAADWTPHLDLGVIHLALRGDGLRAMLLFSALSFGLMLGLFYLWLALLSGVHPRTTDANPIERWVRSHLGRVAHWPAALQLLVPLALVALAWMALHPLLARADVVPWVRDLRQLFEQAGCMGLSAALAWRYVIATVLFLHVIHSYVFLGSHPLWDYCSATAQRLLLPLRWLPLRVARVDLAPILVIAAVLVGAHFAMVGLTRLYPF